MNENFERQSAEQARAPLPRPVRVKPVEAEEEQTIIEPVREDLEEKIEPTPAMTLARRPVPVPPTLKPEIPPRELKPLAPPPLGRRTSAAPPPVVNGARRPPETTPRPAAPRYEAQSNPAPVGRPEPRITAPGPVSLPAGIQRGFPRPQPGSNGAGREPILPQSSPYRPAGAASGEQAPAAPAPAPARPVGEKYGGNIPTETAAGRPEKTTEPPRIEFLEEVLDRLTNPPAQTALLGVCDDQLPVLIDLNDPVPGAILVISDDDALRTRLLRTLIQTSAALNSPRSVQFIVFSANPEEWQNWIESQEIMRHCLSVERLPVIGADPATEGSPERWLLKLSGWADQRRSGGISGPAVILIVDDLQSAAAMEYDARVNFDWLVKEGPAVRIWPVVGLKTSRAKEFTRWVRLFKTRLLGPAEDSAIIQQLSTDNEIEVEPTQFAVRMQETWLKFRVPILPNETY